MKFTGLVFLFIMALFMSCAGQNNTHVVNETKDDHIIVIAYADTITELGDNIMLVYQDKKNNYWFGSWKNGLYKYAGKTILHYTQNNGFPNNRIDEIKEDSSGNIYFSTSDGVIKFDGEQFMMLKVSNTHSDWKLAHNDLWFKDGWNSAFVYRYDNNLLHKLQLPKVQPGEDYIKANPGFPNPYTVYCIYKDRKGNMWFGTGAMGAFRFNGNSFDWIIEKDIVEIYNRPDEPSNGVRAIIEDNEGYFWFNAMFRYKINENNNSSDEFQDNIFYKREKNIGSLDGKPDGNLLEYLSITKDNNNEMWIATYNDGVWRYNGNNITHYIVKEGSNETTLYSIYKDNDGNMWLGTERSGTFKFNGRTFERFKP